jgi:preprotein translocase subunit SecF
MLIPNIYKGNYKLLAIFPVALLIIAAIFIPSIKMGVDFTGGTLISLNLNQKIDSSELQKDLALDGLEANVRVYDSAVGPKAEIELQQNPNLVLAESLKSQFTTLLQNVSILELQSNQNASMIPQYLEARKELNDVSNQMFQLAGLNTDAGMISNLNILQKDFNDAYSKAYSNYRDSISKSINKYVSYSSISVQTVSPVLSTHFMEQAKWVVITAAVLSFIFVFVFFRQVIPSIAVLTGAACDVFIALGAMGIFGIPLTMASFAALLMLVGFSLDTDILLTNRMIKRKGDPREKAYESMKTGATMSITAMIAFSALFILSMMTRIPTYYEISSVALLGLVGDLFATWGINAVMIIWYVEKRGVA